MSVLGSDTPDVGTWSTQCTGMWLTVKIEWGWLWFSPPDSSFCPTCLTPFQKLKLKTESSFTSLNVLSWQPLAPAHGSVAPSLWGWGVEEEEWTHQKSFFFWRRGRSGSVLVADTLLLPLPFSTSSGIQGRSVQSPLGILSCCRFQSLTHKVESGLRYLGGGNTCTVSNLPSPLGD